MFYSTQPNQNMPRPSLWHCAVSSGRLALGLVCLAFLPAAWAVDPPPDGGYPNVNTAEGEDALFSLTIGAGNTAVGYHALFSNTTGDDNTAVGFSALDGNNTGVQNTAVGVQALRDNTSGGNNTATGFLALSANKTGFGNTATGLEALALNTTGSNNTATGYVALLFNTTGGSNTATGWRALYSNTTGSNNTAHGTQALYFNTAGESNTATGWRALYKTTASNNTADGYWALNNNTTGHDNTAVGYASLFNNTTGSNNIAIGPSAGTNLTTGSNNIDIGALGGGGESNTIRIGRNGLQNNVYITGISGVTVPAGVAVRIDSSGHLGTLTSSARYKAAIKPMDKASEAIFDLQPVTFRYKKEIDPNGLPQFGLVAEEVEKVNPDLVVRGEDGKPYTVRYEAVNAMLLNEFIKEHRKGEQQEATIGELKSALARQRDEMMTLAQTVKDQAAQLQKVSEQLATNRTTPRIVASFQDH